MKIIATIAPPGRKGDILREYVDIPSRKDIAKVRSWLSGAVFASPESRAAIPGADTEGTKTERAEAVAGTK
jgi:hypothetical protein